MTTLESILGNQALLDQLRAALGHSDDGSAQTTVETKSTKTNKLPEDYILKGNPQGTNNWDDFSYMFPIMLDHAKLWDSVNQRPTADCSMFVVLQNVASSIAPMLRSATSARDQWAKLKKEFASQTTSAKTSALSSVVQFRPKGNMPKAFETHEQNKRAFVSAFGQTINTSELADLLFIFFLPDSYAAIRAIEQAKPKVDFSALRSSIEIEYARLLATSPAKANLATGEDSASKCPHGYLASECFKCDPCKLCVAAKHRHTWHAPKSSKCAFKDSQPGSSAKANKAAARSKDTTPQVASTEILETLKKLVALMPGSAPTNAQANTAVARGVTTFTVDSGATHSSTNNKDVLSLYNHSSNMSIETAGGHVLPCGGSGTLSILTKSGPATISDILHCDGTTTNLLSVGKLDDKGFSSVFCNQRYYLLPEQKMQSFLRDNKQSTILEGYRNGGLYDVDLQLFQQSDFPKDTTIAKSMLATTTSRSLSDWHTALNHLNYRDTLRLQHMVDGIQFIDKRKCDCEICFLGKATLQPYPPST
jgi:hypothetical protein